jgi:hypothetical protein
LNPASALAQQIYKWTDANGQVHYTDQPPPDRAAATVDTPPAPKPRATTPAGHPGAMVPDHDPLERSAPADNRSGADRRIDALDEDYQRRRLLAQREAEKAATKKTADDAVIAACERAHNTQCNKGVDFIKQREEDLAHSQYSVRKQRWLDGGRVGPPPQAPPPPAVRTTKKK